jgi:hypothetical protein
MTVAIVVELEVVKIEHQQQDGRLCVVGQQALEVQLERPTVAQARGSIVVRHCIDQGRVHCSMELCVGGGEKATA